jgi:amino acid adenylation domain-containing protein
MLAPVANRFHAVARDHAERVALRHFEAGSLREMTYSSFAGQVACFASQLAQCGAKPGAVVAVPAHRHPDTLAILLAVLDSGASFLPVDPHAPSARVEALRHLAGCCLEAGIDPDAKVGTRGLAIRALPGDGAVAAMHNTSADPLDRAAYVMFTSGSTGTPKAVVVPHRAIRRLVSGQDYLRFDPTRVFLQAAPLDFDASTLEIFGPLLNGGTLALHPPGVLPTTGSLRAVIRDASVTTAWLTAAHFNALVDHDVTCLAGLSELIIGGEPLSVPHVRRALDALPGTHLVNGYGPTENTTFTTCYPIPRDLNVDAPRVPIGRPIAGTQCFVVDDDLRVVPPGQEGELVALGDGLALGYLGQPEATAQRFVALQCPDGVTRRAYRTGDRAVELPGGVFDLLGRSDRQVKVSGYRIEPGEVETALAASPSVGQCCVEAATDEHGHKHLVAYVVDSFLGQAGDPNDWTELRADLARRLPAYMVPQRFVRLSALPLTASGKLDRRALPPPFALQARRAPRARASLRREPTLDLVELAWREVLVGAPSSADINFFDAGGSSLAAIRLQGLLEQRSGRALEATFIYDHPTPRRQAAALAVLARTSDTR